MESQGVEHPIARTLVVGLIDGGGTGAELIDCVQRVLAYLADAHDLRFEQVEFDDARWRDQFDEELYEPELHRELVDFYEAIAGRHGVIVRGSLPAPVLYRLRRDVGQAVKWVPLNPFPSISRFPEFRVQLVRESVSGAYHHDEIWREGDVVRTRQSHHASSLRFVAREAF